MDTGTLGGKWEMRSGKEILKVPIDQCIISSFQTMKYFERNDLLRDVLKEITDHILHHKIVSKWDFEEKTFSLNLERTY